MRITHRHIVRFVRNAVLALPLLAVCLSSCDREEAVRQTEPEDAPGFFIQASIFNNAPQGLSGRTKAKTDDNTSIAAKEEVEAMNALRENYIGSIDIFVKESSADAGSPWFKTYHLLPDDADAGFTSGEEIKLHDNWSSAGYKPDTPYDIYVVANDPHTLEGSAQCPANLTALKALSTADSELYKYYTTATGDDAPYGYGYMDTYPATHEKHDKKKEFRMDCTLEGWTIELNSPRQVFDAQLQRDVAKIVIRVHYGNQENIPLVSEDGTVSEKEPGTDRTKNGSLKDYLKYIGRTAVGTPRWKYNNFCFTDGDFASSGIDDGTDLRSYGSSLVMTRDDADPANSSIDNLEDWHYTLVTYSAPFVWGSNAEDAPFVLYSVMFTNPAISESDASRNKLFYYRLPVCDERSVSSLDRNHIYIVDVSICSLGSENANLKLDDSELRIEYHVIPWTEHDVAQNATTTVLVSDTQYLSVSPQEFTLKGNNTQSVTLNYYASLSTADGRFLDIENTATQLTVEYENYLHVTKNITGTVTKQVQTGENTFVTATSVNNDGKKNIVITSTAPGTAGTPDTSSGTQAETVKITITPDGHITVASQALENRAVKKITFTVTLLTSGLTKTIVIKHDPLDNIKNIQGWWSSRIGTVTGIRTGNSNWDEPLSSWTDYESEESTTQVPLSFNEYIAYSASSKDCNQVGVDYLNFLTNQQKNNYFGSNVTSPYTEVYGIENAHYYNGWYYWVGIYENNGKSYYYVYRANSFWYYRLQYFEVSGYNTENTWVRWNEYNSGRHYVSDKYLQAKVYTNNDIYYMNYNGSNYTNATRENPSSQLGGYAYYINNRTPAAGNTASGYTNRQMYVIQLTSTSSNYMIGYPRIVDYASEDRVVSPSFMIASQLGALSFNVTTFRDAKIHCGTYMEVDESGYEYKGWRLPTEEEINVIIEYQNATSTKNITMSPVIMAKYYWTLNGTYSENPSPTGNSSIAYVRCVRDLTLEELEVLNR